MVGGGGTRDITERHYREKPSGNFSSKGIVSETFDDIFLTQIRLPTSDPIEEKEHVTAIALRQSVTPRTVLPRLAMWHALW